MVVAIRRLTDMPVNDYECRKCAQRVEDSPLDLTDEPCANPTCRGVLRRVWAFYLNPVAGGGGSPGRGVNR